MARRRTSSSKVDLQAVLRYIANADPAEYFPLIAWSQERFGCRERAAKDSVAILVKGGWVNALPLSFDRRRRRYVLTEKGRSDMNGSFGQGALRRGRQRYSTCLNQKGRRRQAARCAAGINEFGEALGAETRYLFAGLTNDDLLRALAAPSRVLTRRQRWRTSPLGDHLRAELLGEGSTAESE